MQTQLQKFCQQFDALVRPLLPPFATALQALEQSRPDTPGRELRPFLTELHHHLQVLCDKVAAQQAYVLIFGPLKSGKSTLMNSVATAYVSEVSSLPAYPCLVFVSGGPRREFVVTRYDGTQQTWLDASAVQNHINAAHSELAEGIRAAESMGQVFDPPVHFPQAIRRVDVRVPGGELERSGAVLVDTPGLYTRMRFGYDRMTKDFRDAAACAVFVVKSDTLFLEQVFAEFNQLLELFSRIFLVVNVDAQKRDLGPDGALVPSLEQSRPEVILEAFTDLAMSAPLKRAHADGRVRIYGVDLLRAGSVVLKGLPEADLPKSFVTFRRDLEDYLASAEYLVAFVRDSLQRARGLLGEARALCQTDEAAALRTAVATAEETLQEVNDERQHLQAALTQDMTRAFGRFDSQLGAEVERSARDEGAKLLRTLGASIDTWFLSSHSLHWLLDSQWKPLLADYRQDVFEAARRCFEQLQAQEDAGLVLPTEVAAVCRAFRIDLPALRSTALEAIGAIRWQAPSSVGVDPEQLPVKKGVLDLVTFRSVDKVRARMFGPAAHPDRKIPSKEKNARIGEPGRRFLHEKINGFRAALAPATQASMVQYFSLALREKTIERLLQALRERQPDLEARAGRLEERLGELRAALQPLHHLRDLAGEVPPKLGALGTQYGTALPAAEPDAVMQPQRRRDAGRDAGRDTPRRIERR